MTKHARKCWGEEVVARVVQNARNAEDARASVKSFLETGNIASIFQQSTANGKMTYSNREMSRAETRLAAFVILSMRCKET